LPEKSARVGAIAAQRSISGGRSGAIPGSQPFAAVDSEAVWASVLRASMPTAAAAALAAAARARKFRRVEGSGSLLAVAGLDCSSSGFIGFLKREKISDPERLKYIRTQSCRRRSHSNSTNKAGPILRPAPLTSPAATRRKPRGRCSYMIFAWKMMPNRRGS
jgi:hypothetical protein